MDLQLSKRVVVVVGGYGLIGSAVVERLRGEHATVIPASRNAGDDGIVVDARDDASVARLFERVLAEHGRLDGLVVTAAPSARTFDPAKTGDPQHVLNAVDAKAMGFLRLANAALPLMAEAGEGRIVGVSGQNAFVTGNMAGSIRNISLIVAAKTLADQTAGSGVTVNTVSPGKVTATPSAEVSAGAPGDCTPEQIADLISFLVSPLSSGVSGESIAVGHRVRGAISL